MSNRYKQRRWMDKDIDTPFEKIKKTKLNPAGNTSYRDNERRISAERGIKEFKCLNCGAYVTTGREDSGVNNRNHCPYCLWSRHVDLNKAGDRKASCKGRMRPIGLTLKHTPKRYGCCPQGELMEIHLCAGCGKLSINRIAADDSAYRLYELFMHSSEIEPRVKAKLEAEGIQILGVRDLTTVHSQLFGWQALLEEFEGEPVKQLVSIETEA